MIHYDVPFFANTPDETHCFQAALRMVLKFFWPDRNFTWEKLEKITAKREGLWTWQLAGLLWLEKNGFTVKDIELFDFCEFSKSGAPYLIKFFGEEVGKAQIEHSDINQEIGFSREFIEKIKPQSRIPDVQEIIDLLENGYLLICNVNYRTLNDQKGYAGHSIVLTGYDNNNFILHDPGLPPYENRIVDFGTFNRAWAHPDDTAKNLIAIKLK